MNTDAILDRALDTATSQQAKVAATVGAAFLLVVTVLWWSATSHGPIATMVYAILFVLALGIMPIIIYMLGAATPQFIGKLHFILGSVAFDHHYLVQRETGWEWCPGERGRVWIDGEWRNIDAGETNLSVLNWRPFGVLRDKEQDTWVDERVDTAAQRFKPERETDPTTDGGQDTVVRAGVREVDQPEISGLDGTWLLDLKRMYSRGLKQIGDIELIETAEEVIERGQVDESRDTMPSWVEAVVFVGMGGGFGFAYLLLFA